MSRPAYCSIWLLFMPWGLTASSSWARRPLKTCDRNVKFLLHCGWSISSRTASRRPCSWTYGDTSMDENKEESFYMLLSLMNMGTIPLKAAYAGIKVFGGTWIDWKPLLHRNEPQASGTKRGWACAIAFHLVAARCSRICWLTLDLNVVLADVVPADYEPIPPKKSKRSAAGLKRAAKRQKRDPPGGAQDSSSLDKA